MGFFQTPSLTGSLDESFPGSFANTPDMLESYLTAPATIDMADDATFESAFVQALSENDAYLLTSASDMHYQSNFPFLL